ncbi:MAG: DUF924 domain-containing protein [Rhodobiaceae bacterium]|nr:DUF924 domain-containing protein [Rhodobiaceae bacterium]MCC0056882.1 DUF924 domain-containing protein [Rhodobiaceae bacterium]
MTQQKVGPGDILDFWWKAGESRWYASDPEFDRDIAARFSAAYEAAAGGELDAWAEDAPGCLALIILLDQFSRNMFRKDAKAFAQDGKARSLAHVALDRGYDRQFPPVARQFFYLPFMHSEDIDDQSLCVDLFRQLGNQNNYFYALVHMDAIRRFGRFPHRNAVLGRRSTEAEEAYMASGGFSA